MRTLAKDLKSAFGKRFLDLRECENNRYSLYLNGTKFTNEDLTIVTQYGFAYHIGFLSVQEIGQVTPCLRVELARY